MGRSPQCPGSLFRLRNRGLHHLDIALGIGDFDPFAGEGGVDPVGDVGDGVDPADKTL